MSPESLRPAPRVVVVSGGSHGLGGALVEHFLARGDTVATFSRSASPTIERLLATHADDGRFAWEPVDAADPAAVTGFARGVLRRHRRVDALVNNAGIAVEGLLTTTADAAIHRALAVNLESALLLTRGCLKGMLAARGGAIVSVSSVNAVRGHKGLAVYSATKSALHGFTRALAREVGPQGIRVNAVAPGFFESPMVEHLDPAQRATIVRRTPMRALASVDDLVASVEFLLSTPSITGQVLAVDGGFSC
jgi:3-oxoacyl-[acyl-carrier protein] reductase